MKFLVCATLFALVAGLNFAHADCAAEFKAINTVNKEAGPYRITLRRFVVNESGQTTSEVISTQIIEAVPPQSLHIRARFLGVADVVSRSEMEALASAHERGLDAADAAPPTNRLHLEGRYFIGEEETIYIGKQGWNRTGASDTIYTDKDPKKDWSSLSVPVSHEEEWSNAPLPASGSDMRRRHGTDLGIGLHGAYFNESGMTDLVCRGESVVNGKKALSYSYTLPGGDDFKVSIIAHFDAKTKLPFAAQASDVIYPPSHTEFTVEFDQSIRIKRPK
jgi:hypothetical protein